MNIVEPIRDKGDIEKLKIELMNQNYRDYLLFILAINTGMKITDMLKLKFLDIKVNDKFISSIHIKDIEYPLNSLVKESCATYHTMLSYNNKIVDSYIFLSRKGQNPIDRSHAYRILNDAAKQVGLNYKVGPHTLRKTFGYHHFKQYRDIKYLQKIFNHSTEKQTLKYIGIEQLDLLINSMNEFNL